MESVLENCRTTMVAAMNRCGYQQSEIDTLLGAFEYAAVIHANETRGSDGSPYITHPVALVLILTNDLGITDLSYLLIAILHDTIEDGGEPTVIFQDIQRVFGVDVARGVQTLTQQPHERGYLRRIRSAPIREQMIKLVDRLHNVSNPDKRDPVRFARKLEETRREILPIARMLVNRLSVVERWRGTFLLKELTERSRARR